MINFFLKNIKRIEKWVFGRDQIQSACRKTRWSNDEAEGVVVQLLKILERYKVVPWKSVWSSNRASKKLKGGVSQSSQHMKRRACLEGICGCGFCLRE